MTLVVILGISPFAFGYALLDLRLARAAIGDLVIGLRSARSPPTCATPSPALRDPSLELAYWLPEFETYADLEGREVVLPRPAAAGADGDRAGGRARRGAPARPVAARRAGAARRRRRRGRHHARERAPAGRAARAPGGAARLAGPHRRGRPPRAQAPRAQPPRRRAAAARRHVPRAGAAGAAPGRRRGPRERRARPPRSPPRCRSCGRSPAASTPPSSPATASRWRWSSSRRSRPCPWRSTSGRRAAAGGARGRRVLPRQREPRQRRQVRPGDLRNGRRRAAMAS